MQKNMEYRSTIKSRSFLYPELKKAANLSLQGLKKDEIREQALRENLFQVASENRKREITPTILARLGVLDHFLKEKLVHSSLETSKLIALYAILKTDRLFFEFMNEVFRDKVLLNDLLITDKDFSVFFRSKAEQSETVASWKDYTFYKLQQVYIRILNEAGLIKNKKEKREIILPLMEDDIVQHLQDTKNEIYLEALGVKQI